MEESGWASNHKRKEPGRPSRVESLLPTTSQRAGPTFSITASAIFSPSGSGEFQYTGDSWSDIVLASEALVD